MILSERAARDIAERVLARARGDSASVVIGASEERNLRFARNGATTNGLRNSIEVAVTINFGRRSGTYSTSQIDEAERKGILTPTEAEAVRAFDRRVLDVTGVDDFDPMQLRRTGA